MKPPEQPKGQGLGSHQSGGTLGDVGKSRALGKYVEALRPSPMPCSVHLFHVTVPELQQAVRSTGNTRVLDWYVKNDGLVGLNSALQNLMLSTGS